MKEFFEVMAGVVAGQVGYNLLSAVYWHFIWKLSSPEPQVQQLAPTSSVWNGLLPPASGDAILTSNDLGGYKQCVSCGNIVAKYSNGTSGAVCANCEKS